MISPLTLFIAQSDSGLRQQDEQRAKQAEFVSWPHLLTSTDLSLGLWYRVQAASSFEPLWKHRASESNAASTPLRACVGRDLKAQPVGPYRGAKGWYSGSWNSVKCLNSLSKARIT